MKMRSTAECLAMNIVYAALKTVSPDELRKMFDEAVLRATVDDCRFAKLFAYQIRIEVQNRLKGTP